MLGLKRWLEVCLSDQGGCSVQAGITTGQRWPNPGSTDPQEFMLYRWHDRLSESGEHSSTTYRLWVREVSPQPARAFSLSP